MKPGEFLETRPRSGEVRIETEWDQFRRDTVEFGVRVAYGMAKQNSREG